MRTAVLICISSPSMPISLGRSFSEIWSWRFLVCVLTSTFFFEMMDGSR